MRGFLLLFIASFVVAEAKRLMVKVDSTSATADVEAVLGYYGEISVRLPQINTYFLEVSHNLMRHTSN